MTDYDLELSYRAASHPLWTWTPGMLGVELGTSGTLDNFTLERRRHNGEAQLLKGFGPSLRDSLTTHLIWERIKKFDVPGYSLVRYYSSSVYKAGFKRYQGRSVLLFTGAYEGLVAVRMWMWFANKQLELMKESDKSL